MKVYSTDKFQSYQTKLFVKYLVISIVWNLHLQR